MLFSLLILLTGVTGHFFVGFAQTKKSELTSRRDELNDEISKTKQLIKEYQSQQRSASNELALLNQQIQLREELIREIGNEVGSINNQIVTGESTIKSLEQEQADLKREYGQMIYNGYKQRNSYNRLAFILSSDDFFQAVKRVEFLKQYAENRKMHLGQIKGNQNAIAQNISSLEVNREQKLSLSHQEMAERNEISADKSEQQGKLNKLKSEEAKLRQVQQKQEQERKQLTAKIQEIINKEIQEERERERLANERARKEAEAKRAAEAKTSNANNATASTSSSSSKTGSSTSTSSATTSTASTSSSAKTTSSTKMELAPEVSLANSVFEQNKGNLPWPVSSGAISSKYGRHPHTSIPGIEVNNNGVDFLTSSNAPVLAVFNGTVTSVFPIAGAGYNIIITHGTYKTVYSGLAGVNVTVGTKVSTKQSIGTVADNGDGYMLHFELWRVSETAGVAQNPELWLKKK